MTSTTLEKVKKPKGIAKKKSKMTYLEALDYIDDCNATLKMVAKNRIKQPEKLEDYLVNRSMTKSLAISGATLAAGLGTCMADVSPFGDSVFAVGAPFLAFFGIPLFNGILCLIPGWSKVSSPLKAKTKEQEIYDSTEDWENRESAFEQVEMIILHESKKAVDIINQNVGGEGKELKYSKELGKEGFEIVQSESISSIQQAKFAAIKELEIKKEMLSLEASSTESNKALEA